MLCELLFFKKKNVLPGSLVTYDDAKSSILSRKRKRRGGNLKEGDGEIIINHPDNNAFQG